MSTKPPDLPAAPPEAWEPLQRLARFAGRPLERFFRIEAASGVLLLVAAAIALGWANSPWADGYERLWHVPLGVRLGSFTFERSLEWFINDVLMVVFFFVVGMEIRREVHQGGLSHWRRAALPVAGALGGMLVPAVLYLAFAGGAATRMGWGVPIATDIAFAVGILTILGKRVPAALRILLLALAVIDDLGAIIVIALFYSSGVELSGFLVAGLGLAGILLLQWLGVRAKPAYVVPAFLVWAGIYAAGVHPTIAGVLVGLVTPVRAWLGQEGFVARTRDRLELLEEPRSLGSHELVLALRDVNVARREALSPAEGLVEILHPWVAYGIMPLFALANAGVSLSGGEHHPAGISVGLGVFVGLVVGKPVGVFAAMWLALRARLGTLPSGIVVRHLIVLALVAGVGFTMSVFIAQLAFANAALLGAAKVGVLLASAVAGVIGLASGRALLPVVSAEGSASLPDEAEPK